MERNGRMSFREDVFAKIVTYITIAVLLGAMLVEAFVIYMERKEKEETAAQLEAAQENISQLSELNLNLEEDREELQEFKDNWQNLVILADNETCQLLREDLAARPELIPEAAIEASVLAEEADRLGEEEADQETLPNAQFTFPSPEEKEWLLPLNLGNHPSVEYLFYARAEDTERERYIDILYQIPYDREKGEPILDEDGQIIWRCMAYDAGLGWQLYEEEE